MKSGGTDRNRTCNSCLGNNRYIHLTTAPACRDIGSKPSLIQGFRCKWAVRFLAALVFFTLGGGQGARAETESARVLPGGVVGPGNSEAARDNPASLPDFKNRGFELQYGPSILGSTVDQYGSALNARVGDFGFGFVYSRSDLGSNVNSDDFNLGMGWRPSGNGKVSLGLGLGHNFVTQLTQANLAVHLGDGTENNAALVLKDLGGSPYLVMGYGFIDNKRYTMEVNLQTPGLEGGLGSSGSTYFLSIHSTVYADVFALGFGATYPYVVGQDQTHLMTYDFSLMLDFRGLPALTMKFLGSQYSSFALTFLF